MGCLAIPMEFLRTTRIALVLPAALLNGVAWGKSRELLLQNYSVEVVIVSHDARKWSFSENTSLSETLLVAQKKPSDNKEVIFINLWQNPATIGDALAVASAINQTKPAKLGSSKKVGLRGSVWVDIGISG